MPDGSRIRLPHRFKPRAYQVPPLVSFDKGKKRLCLVWHRRAGKEKTLINLVAREMQRVVGVYYYFFPTYAQGKKVLWQGIDRDGMPFMEHFPDDLVDKRNEADLSITYKNGSRFQIIGSDNIDSIVGTNPRGCVFAEYALQDPRAWVYMQPILLENGGWAAFDFTPRGRNHAYDLYQTALANPEDWFVSLLTIADTKRDDGTPVISEAQIDQLRRENVEEELIQQEYYCSFAGAHSGTPFSRELELAEKSGRICAVPFDINFPVDTWWDLGMGDTTAIWFTQDVGREIRVLEAIEQSGGGLDWGIKELRTRREDIDYAYARHTAPHDIKVREWTNAKGRLATAAARGVNFSVMPSIGLQDGIDQARRIIRRCVFDTVGTKNGRNALGSYHYEWDDKLRRYSAQPVHDWSSNFADAWRTLGVAHKTTQRAMSEAEHARENRIQISSSGVDGADNADWMGA